MGFNTKTMEDGKEYNLNLSYDKIIKPVLKHLNINCIRADEIMCSEIIDESMYRLLLCADLVIADITTLNPNALYELGVRYALKPYSTILICAKNTRFPFDINHLRIFTYEHNGLEITQTECKNMQENLLNVIENIKLHNGKIDSPVYKYVEGLIPPKFPQDTNYFDLITKRFKSSDSLCNLVNIAYTKREQGDFLAAAELYKKALAISRDEYIIKEIAVCIYQGDTKKDYDNALKFLKKEININTTTNPELLKALGTIYKNLWIKCRYEEYAKQSLLYYEKSFILYSSHNSGLNYGFMLYAISKYQKDKENKQAYVLWAKHIYNETRKICLQKYNIDDYWINTSLEECALALNFLEEYNKYKRLAEYAISLLPENMT